MDLSVSIPAMLRAVAVGLGWLTLTSLYPGICCSTEHSNQQSTINQRYRPVAKGSYG
jgi:hypothetical protein